jgi:hypothetical protein
MKKDKVKKLTLNRETLRDLMAHNAGEVKGGAKGGNTKKYTCAPTCAYTCMFGCQGTLYCPRTVGYDSNCC